MTQRTSPAMLGSLLLHASLAAAILLLKPWAHDLPVGAVVPVNIISNAAYTDLRAAEQAPIAETAQTETPVPDAPVAPAALEPAVSPAPTTPALAKPAIDPKILGQKTPTKPAKSLDLDALAASIAKSTGGKTSSAAKGPPRPETALAARDAAGAGKALMASALSGLAGELQRRWNPNCEVEGGKDVRVRVTFSLGAGGQLVGLVEAGGQENATNPVIRAAAERAIRAVHQAAPFSTLPRDLLGQKVAVNFNAREACA